ncbi:MAG: rhodanese-like domain-containing protein [Planctomycetes bacterium]|nr:rhodanese-like domain-containing protein [Planctomycetota bacterium]
MIRTLTATLALFALSAPVATCETCGCTPKAAAAEHGHDHAKGDHLHAPDLKKLIDAKAVTLIDCNGGDSFKAGRIPGAIDFSASKDKLAGLLPKDKAALIVAYCGGPKCGAYKAGVEAATKLGYTNVKHFGDGLSGWKEAGFALEK